MKYLVLLTILISGHVNGSELERAFGRELDFLRIQKQRIVKSISEQKSRAADEVQLWKQKINASEKELVFLQTENQKAQIELKKLEAMVRDQQSAESVRKDLSKQIRQELIEVESVLAMSEDIEAVNIDDSSLNELMTQGLNQLTRLSRLNQQPAAFLDENKNIKSQAIIRVGAAAAMIQDLSGHQVLAPDRGHMKVIQQESSSPSGFTALYLFDSLQSQVELKKAKTWIETTADMIPAAALAFLFLIVGWLFLRLAKI